MRLIGEGEVEEEGEEVVATEGAGGVPPRKLVVGYALTSKKAKSFLQQKFEGLARKKGIVFVAIDLNTSLSEQGPFDIILHKEVPKDFDVAEGLYHQLKMRFMLLLRGKDWRRVLEDYSKQHPEVTVFDPPKAIQYVYNRQAVLKVVADLFLSDHYGNVGVPRQLVITKDTLSVPGAVALAGLSFPLVVKPLVVDGSAKSHQLYLAYDQLSLSMLDPPLVLQEFVNHGGLLFKVFIVGEAIKVVRRFSLPDVSKQDLSSNTGLFRFPRVSCAAASADKADLDPTISELPPQPLLERLAKELRQKLGLQLFNIDILRERGSRDQYYVIDINYFPGYGKLPGYEHVFTDFLLSVVQSKHKRCQEGNE